MRNRQKQRKARRERMRKEGFGTHNAEGYTDPTAYHGIRNAMRDSGKAHATSTSVTRLP